MEARPSIVANCDVADRTQDFGLLVDGYFLVGLRCEVEETKRGLAEGADRC
jgi:hypothetical protein